MKKVVVIGAGASGIMAAGQAALAGADVLVLEKMKQPANKLIISGKGRCNITNDSELHDFLGCFNRSGRFLHQAFSRFFTSQLMQFFKKNGLALVTERGGRVFPASGSARDVVDTLLNWLKKSGARLRCDSPVSEIVMHGNRVAGVISKGTLIPADSVILAAGGSSYPATGSTGDGYAMARAAGHNIVTLRPALIPLETRPLEVKELAGLDLRNVGVRIYINGKRKINDFGEVGFTRFGIGGPVILTHSLLVVDSLRAGKKISIGLDLKPALDDSKLDARLQRDFTARNKEELSSILRGLLPQKICTACLKQTGLDGKKKGGEITGKERNRLRTWLKDFRIDITGHRPLREAIVTAGGVNVNEVNPNTMESRLVGGLYLTGELLDINGETGGYNLQAAFSTGWVAGCAAAIWE